MDVIQPLWSQTVLLESFLREEVDRCEEVLHIRV